MQLIINEVVAFFVVAMFASFAFGIFMGIGVSASCEKAFMDKIRHQQQVLSGPSNPVPDKPASEHGRQDDRIDKILARSDALEAAVRSLLANSARTSDAGESR
ncbi:uncharacterized protein PFL1_03383 [Pseudozyma flocculosa PF-1]|uniref:Uncharacterized protein n=2 Tax=Pseudozyma flocculosa TaxID=84751 RepID=A0A5C3F6L7_9BASI|nr:uncharacterized protein PFL1_03383 [Pseudozyma flocculosa PF-1]EPQ29094.1 hypothetical protein PFL1_03383 [Pseudozyma flocculosa PF-1]SPO40088.1 uncharacterized protein PSFLO_05570 [Pseudozyma flocculosa]